MDRKALRKLLHDAAEEKECGAVDVEDRNQDDEDEDDAEDQAED